MIFPRCIAAIGGMLVSAAALAADLSFQIDQVYSNADGSVQFIVLHETAGLSGQDQFAGSTLTVTQGTRARTFTFPGNLPSANTANHYVLIATQGYVAAATKNIEFTLSPPDFVIPDRFLPADGATINFAGSDQMTYKELPRDGFSSVYRSGNAVRDNSARDFGGGAIGLPVIPVTAVEFVNAALDHYFISDLAPDIDALDSGRIAGWVRTGQSFKVWPISLGFLSPVCRFYIPAEHGNSHFFSASTVECATVLGKVGVDPNFSGYIQETSEVFDVALPDSAGVCPSFWGPVYRLWNQRTDSNHRYTTDPAIKAQMVARGYVAEGYGPDAVAMCTPL